MLFVLLSLFAAEVQAQATDSCGVDARNSGRFPFECVQQADDPWAVQSIRLNGVHDDPPSSGRRRQHVAIEIHFGCTRGTPVVQQLDGSRFSRKIQVTGVFSASITYKPAICFSPTVEHRWILEDSYIATAEHTGQARYQTPRDEQGRYYQELLVGPHWVRAEDPNAPSIRETYRIRAYLTASPELGSHSFGTPAVVSDAQIVGVERE